MVADLQWFWVFRSMTGYGLAWSRRVLNHEGTSGHLRVRLARGAGPLAAEEQCYDEAEQWIHEALAYWQGQGDSWEAASDVANLSKTARLQGRLVEALDLATQSIALVEASQKNSYRGIHKLSGITSNRAEILCDLGRLEEAHADALGALSVAELEDGDTYLYHDAVRVMGRISLALELVDEAAEWFERASRVGSRLGSDFKGRALNGLATVALIRGQWADAEALLLQSMEVLEDKALDRLETMRLMSLALLFLQRPREATDLARMTVARAAGGAGDRNLAATLEIAGICDVIADDAGRGWTLIEAGRESLRAAGIKQPSWHASLLLQLAEIYEIDLREAPPGTSVPPLSTSDAGRLVLAPR
jgi:tetratricopeptide (TPR) repeat protein